MPVLAFVFLIFFNSKSHAQSAIELTCRSQAKEVAVQSYQNCVTQAKAQRIDEIRKEYQAKLTDLKSYYDQELKKVSGSKKSSKSKPKKQVATTTSEDLTKLPEKQIQSQTLPVHSTSTAQTAVVPSPEIKPEFKYDDEQKIEPIPIPEGYEEPN